MLPELSEIKRLRKKHGLTQSQLSKRAGVSQSLIAKIESDRIDPAFTNVRKVFDVLNSMNEQSEHKAEELMVKRITSCCSSDSVDVAIRSMRNQGISQLPVINSNVAVGLVTESNLLDVLAGGKKVSGMKVEDVMQEAPPIVSKKTPIRIIIDLLKYSPLILIADNGRFEGVITKADVLRFKSG